MNVSRTAAMLKSEQLNAIKLLRSHLLSQAEEKRADFMQRLMLMTGQLSAIARFKDMHTQLSENL